MDLMLFAVARSDSHLSLEAGDLLAVDFRRARMWTRDRIIQPNYGYLAGLLTDGTIVWITPTQSAQEATLPPPFPVRVVA